MYKKYAGGLLAFSFGIFIAVFFTSLLVWTLNDRFGTFYLLLGLTFYYLGDQFIYKKNDSKKVDLLVNNFVFGLGLVLFFQVSTLVGILLAIPTVIYGVLSLKKLNITFIPYIVGATLALFLIYLGLPITGILPFIGGILFYVVAKEVMSSSRDYKLLLLIGLILGVIPFILSG